MCSAGNASTALSGLERNLKSPTLDKLGQVAVVLQVRPVTLIAMSALAAPEMGRARQLLALLDSELGSLTDIGPGAG
jgi:transcriptional regulator with XRE-family HTH domain